MQRRFQVFISSTYEDLKLERQAAVQSILKAGHIPAGMELFTAGDKSQMDVIRRWIDESDLFMLILGARYGSIEPTTGKSYVELELDYAIKTATPFFSVVLSDEGREAKVQRHGTKVLESKNEEAYRKLRERVTSHLCAFFTLPIDVKLAVFETLPQITADNELVGWVSAADIEAPTEVSKQIAQLSKENSALRAENEKLQKKLQTVSGAGATFDELFATLLNEKVSVPANVTDRDNDVTVSLLDVAISNADLLASGVTNSSGIGETESFVYYKVASPLASYGLVQHGKAPTTAKWSRLILSKEGAKFLTLARVRLEKIKSQSRDSEESSASSTAPKKKATKKKTAKPKPAKKKASRKTRTRKG